MRDNIVAKIDPPSEDWALGWLSATADVACREHDSLVEEMLRSVGVTKKTHLRKYALSPYERRQLMAYFWRAEKGK